LPFEVSSNDSLWHVPAQLLLLHRIILIVTHIHPLHSCSHQCQLLCRQLI
jgi:hypothetical protein